MNARAWTFACGALLVLSSAITYRPWIADARIERLSGPLDSWTYFGGSALYLDTALHRGEFPLWNPLVLCGAPYAANPQSKVFYPPQLLRSALNVPLTPASTHVSLRVYGVAHALLAGIGMFLLARRHGLSPVASMVSAYALALSGHCVLRVVAYHFIDVFAWLPFGLLFLNHALSAPSRRHAVVFTIAAGLAGALSLLAGYPQAFIYCALIAAVYAVGGAWLGVFTAARPRMVLHALLVLAGAGGVAVLGAMALIFPAAEFYVLGARRGSAALAADTVGTLSRHGLARILLLFGGEGAYTPGLSCLGITLLALGAWLHPARRLALLIFILIWAGIDLTLGPPFPLATFANLVSPFELPAPRRALIVATLPWALAAGLGVDAVIRLFRSADVEHMARRLAIGGAAVVFAAALTLDLLSGGTVEPFASHPVLHALAYLLPGGMVAFVYSARRMQPGTMAAVMLAAIAIEIGIWNTVYVPQLVNEPASVPASLLHTSPEHIGRENFRIVHDAPNLNMYTLEPAIVGYEPGAVGDVWRALSPPDAPDFTRKLTAAASTRDSAMGNLLVKRPFWLAAAWARGDLPPAGVLWPPARVVFLEETGPAEIAEVSVQSVPDTPIGQEGAAIPVEDWMTDARTGAVRGRLPAISAHSVLRVRYLSAQEGRVDSYFVERSNKSRRYGWQLPVYVTQAGLFDIPLPESIEPEFELVFHGGEPNQFPEITQIEVIPDTLDLNDPIRIADWRANTVIVEVNGVPSPRLLVFTDAYYPGWRAFVDGQETPILRADGAFKAVLVPAGTHRIEFRFLSRTVFIGVMVSAAAWIASLAAMGVLLLAERRTRDAAYNGG